MKLFLTSAGLQKKKIADFFLTILPKQPKNCSVLMMAYILSSEMQKYVDQARKELVDLGFKNIIFFDLKKDKFEEMVKEFDIIYVCGGNTFWILDRLRKIGLTEFIKDGVRNKGVIYFGVSAGSIIAGPSIEIAGWGSEGDKNTINLKDLTGFRLTKIAIFPHFRPQMKDEVKEFKKRVSNPVMELTDNEAIYIDESGYRKIS